MRKMQVLLFMCLIHVNIFGDIDIETIVKTNNVSLSMLWFEPYYSCLFNNQEVIKSLQLKAEQKPYTKAEDSALWTLIRMGNTESNIAAVDVIKRKILDSEIKDSEIESIIYYDAADCGTRMLSLLNSASITNSIRFKKNKLLQQYSKDSIKSLSVSIETHIKVLQDLLDEYKKNSYKNMFVWETFRILADKVSVESFDHYGYTDETFEPMALPKLIVGDYSIYYQYYDSNNIIKQSGIVSVMPVNKKDYPVVNTNSLAFGEIPEQPPLKGCVFHLSPVDMKVLKDAYKTTQKNNK